jgi:ATP phosphoribosyltransferase
MVRKTALAAETELKVALPKGDLLADTAALLERADWQVAGYTADARLYRLQSGRHPGLSAKILNERDIPVQVAVGNYDLGICGADWVRELMVKFRSVAVVKVKDLGYGGDALRLVASPGLGVTSREELTGINTPLRITSEYPNIAESFALEARLRRFSIFGVYGSPGIYPPEHAELAIVRNSAGVPGGLVDLGTIWVYGACLIANRRSWGKKNLSELLTPFGEALGKVETAAAEPEVSPIEISLPDAETDKDILRLALPDGHQQSHVVKLLEKAGIRIADYPSANGNCRPVIDIPGTVVKVIRPQDMPTQIAIGNFDLAITGRDWLREHLYQFPASPVKELLDLKYGWVRLVAVVSETMGIEDTAGLKEKCAALKSPLRVASEYINIADAYAREKRLGEYRIIPTWGATEAFLPEDADLLIENTETGGTIKRHNLKIIDTLFESTACLVGHTGRLRTDSLKPRVAALMDALRRGLEAGD